MDRFGYTFLTAMINATLWKAPNSSSHYCDALPNGYNDRLKCEANCSGFVGKNCSELPTWDELSFKSALQEFKHLVGPTYYVSIAAIVFIISMTPPSLI